ncbi:histidine kinase [Polaribacter sp. SA4-10]|uniref:tetratricopeptide repeat-containing sensor histidine kinase n=1 Tax=Polaribacter sp. SA4-10 TaxID=754397 RepID=UPI000B3D124B|nr:tetratricopeptide repeat-containing sensor histidine kinase [Polaribacter sp. SA4-10]ARV07600.1 histidine kinase [Polaribacter sp. SA4-10]
MVRKLKLLFIFAFFSFFQLKATINKAHISEEASFKEASSAFLFQKDSVFDAKYKSIVKLYKEEKFIEALKKSLEIYDGLESRENNNSQYRITTLIADIYDKTNKYHKALQYHKEALFILNNSSLKESNYGLFVNSNYAKTILRIGSFYHKLSNIDSAKFYYEKLEKFSSLNKDVLGFKATSFGNLSGIFEKDSLFEKAKEYAIKAIDIHKIRNDRAGQAIAVNNLGNIYLSLGDYKKSKELYQKGIGLIENDNSPIAIRYKASLYSNLAWAMRNLKDYNAYDIQELSYEIEDGIRDMEVRTMIETVAAEYDVKEVKKEEENKRVEDQRTFWVYGVGSFIVIISLLYWVNYYKLRQKNLGLKLSQSQLLQNQNLEKLKSDSQIRILNATIDGKESERKQIAETLHDSVSALLSSANLHLQATRKQYIGEIPLEIGKTQEIITEASQKIRDLSHTLVSSVLLKFGLNYAVTDMAEKYSNSQIKIKTQVTNIRRYDQNFEIKVYNIIQEFINNILKHSDANNATVNLAEVDTKLCIKISDDGVGFDKTKIGSKDGLGLNQIDARIQMMKGKFQIDTSVNNGTYISVELPILEKETFIHA